MWRGTGPTVVRLSLGAGINFVVLEKLKAIMLQASAGASYAVVECRVDRCL